MKRNPIVPIIVLAPFFSACGGYISSDLPSTSVGDAGGTQTVTADATPIEDSNTLRVVIGIDARPPLVAPTSSDEAQVTIHVQVWDADSNEEVRDALVRGGPVDQMVSFSAWSHPDPYALWQGYSGAIVGYQPTWEFAITRGKDHLTGIVLAGPSYASVTFAPSPDGATIGWSPANESNVTTEVCAAALAPLPSTTGSLRWCKQGGDEGEMFLESSNEYLGGADPFPLTGTNYLASVTLSIAGLPVGSRGGLASFQIFVASDVVARSCG
jgi:hypothetical protein